MKSCVQRWIKSARVALLLLLTLVSTGASLADVCASVCGAAAATTMQAGAGHTCCKHAATASYSIEKPACTHPSRAYQDTLTVEAPARPERLLGPLCLQPSDVAAVVFSLAPSSCPARAVLARPALSRAASPLPLRV